MTSGNQIQIEFRCPRDRRTMFGKIIRFSIPWGVSELDPGTLIEFSCPECKRVLSKRGLLVQRVLHSFSIDGTYRETQHVGKR